MLSQYQANGLNKKKMETRRRRWRQEEEDGDNKEAEVVWGRTASAEDRKGKEAVVFMPSQP